MKAIEKDGYLYDPPSWKVCPVCRGQGISYDEEPCHQRRKTGEVNGSIKR